MIKPFIYYRGGQWYAKESMYVISNYTYAQLRTYVGIGLTPLEAYQDLKRLAPIGTIK